MIPSPDKTNEIDKKDQQKSNEIFISYRRADVEFTQKICGELERSGFTVWFDLNDIPPGAERFDDEIQRGIEGANAFLCILSPRYLASLYCMSELQEAARLKKKVVPIVLEKFDDLPTPPEIEKINWVYFTEHAKQKNPFEEAFPKVIQAIQSDYEHSREHTRLLLRAIDWQKNDKGPGYVLKGSELEKAERWQVAAANKVPAPTELHSEYILASRKDATRRQRNTITGVAVALIVSIALGIAAVIQWREAEKQANLSQSRALIVNTQLTGSKIVSNLLLSLASFDLVKGYDYPDRIVAEQSLRDSLSRQSGIPLRDENCPITSLTFSPDGRWLATGSNSDTGCLWNANDFSVDPIVLQAEDIGHFGPVFSPDSKWLATAECIVLGGACAANRIHVWDVQNPAAPPVVLTGPGFSGAGNFTFIPDSSRVLISDGRAIFIWDIANPNAGSLSFEQEDFITSLAVSRDGKWLITGSWDKITRLWDLGNLSAGYRALPGIDIVVNTFSLSEDGQWLAAGGGDGNVYLWDMQELSSDPTILTGDTVSGQAAAPINSLAISADSHWLATGSGGQLTVWNLEDQSQRFIFGQISENIRDIRFSPDSQWVSTGLYLWNIRNPSSYQKPILLQGLDEVNSVAFSKDNRWLAAAGSDEMARLWDLKSTDREFFFLHPFNEAVETTMFSQDGRWLFARDFTGAARLWDLNDPSSTPILMDKIMSGSAFSPDSRWLALSICTQADETNSSACLEGKAGLLDMANPSAEPNFILDHPVSSFTFSEDGQWLAANNEVINMKDLSAKPIIPGGAFDSVSSLSFSPDSQWLAAVSKVDEKGIGLLWNMNDLSSEPVPLPGEDSAKLQDEPIVEQGIKTLAFSPDSKWVAASECIKAINFPIVCTRHSVKLWALDNPSAQPITHEIELTSGYDETLTFSPDNRWLVINADDTFLWDRTELTKAPVTLASLAGNVGRSISVSFSPDSQVLAIGGDGSIQLFNMQYLSNDPIVLRGHEETAIIYSVAFSPDGQWLATAGGDRTVRMWSMDTEYLIQIGCQRTGRNFTREEWKQYFPNQEYPASPENATCSTLQLEAVATPAVITTQDTEFMNSLQPVATLQNRPIEGGSVTSTPVSAEAEAPPVEGGSVTESPAPHTSNIFIEEFDGNMDSWSTFMTSGIARQVKPTLEDGNFNVQLVISEDKLPWAYWVNDSSTFSSVQVEAVVTNNGNNSNGVSLICQYSEAGWYEFTVSNAGLYAIYAYDPNRLPAERYQQLIAGGSPAIRAGFATNTYRADCNGTELSLSINGTVVNTYTDVSYNYTEGKIGFGASSPNRIPVDVTFESLAVSIAE